MPQPTETFPTLIGYRTSIGKAKRKREAEFLAARAGQTSRDRSFFDPVPSREKAETRTDSAAMVPGDDSTAG